MNLKHAFDLSGKVAVITGGNGMLGRQHADAIQQLGGSTFALDIASPWHYDVTSPEDVADALATVLDLHHRVDILINNAANNPKVEDGKPFPTFETLSLAQWNADLAVGLTGAFLTTQVFGEWMADNGGGVILNIASELAVIGPDQRIYANGPKPASYSAAKAGLLGLTRYTATYWADKGVRCNALLPGGVGVDGMDKAFVKRLTSLVPLGRMARADEYQAAIAFLCSDASAFMTGAFVSIDGGRTAW